MEIVKNEFLTDALARLKKETGQVSGQKEKAMAAAVGAALADFCTQEPEFAQAIVQGGSFGDCMKAVAKGVGASISDSEAFARAARFYFPGSKVRVVMQIDLIGDAGETDSSTARADVGVGPYGARNDKTEAPKKLAVDLIDLTAFF